MASVRKVKKKFRVEVRRIGLPYVCETFIDKSSATKFAKKIEVELEERRYKKVSKADTTTFKQCIRRYRDEKLKAKSPEWYRCNTINKQPLSKKLLADLNSSDFAEFKRERLTKISPSSINRELSLCSKIIKTAMYEYNCYLDTNPVHGSLKMKENPHRTRILSDEEYARLVSVMSKKIYWQVMFIIATLTGMRKSELLNAKWNNINFEKRTWFIPQIENKNNTERTVPLNNEVLGQLKRLPIAISGKVFIVSRNNFWWQWVKFCKLANVEGARFHDNRRLAITNLLESGLFSDTEVTQISGHKTMQMLKTYSNHRTANLVKKIQHVN